MPSSRLATEHDVDEHDVDEHDIAVGDAAMSHDDVNRLRLVLLRLTRSIRARYTGDITPSQLAVLSSVLRHGPSTIGQIAEYEHVQAPSASKIVSVLESKGLIERAVDSDDRRCVKISGTDAAEAYIAEIREAGTSWLAEQIDELSADEAQTLLDALPALERLLAATS